MVSSCITVMYPEKESDMSFSSEVKEELADVINYCLLMADKLGVDPKQIVLDKMEKTAKKYPVEKAKGKSTKYNRL